jgi:hypothetical protein
LIASFNVGAPHITDRMAMVVMVVVVIVVVVMVMVVYSDDCGSSSDVGI